MKSSIIEMPKNFKIPNGLYRGVYDGCGNITLETGWQIKVNELLVPPEEHELITWTTEHWFWESLHKNPKYNVTLIINGNLYICPKYDNKWHPFY